MNTIYAFILSLLAGLSTLLGCIFIYLPIKKENVNKYICLSLSFSIAIMIGISLFDLLPESFPNLYEQYNVYSFIIILTSILISYILIKMINKNLEKYNNLYKVGLISMIVLMMHNMPEGILTFLSSYQNPKLGLKITLAIAMHNIPEGIAISIPLYYATGKKKEAIIKTMLSGFSEPIGGLIAYIIFKKIITNTLISLILVIVSGLMISLAIESMFPEIKKYEEKKSIIYGFILGIIVIIFNLLL